LFIKPTMLAEGLAMRQPPTGTVTFLFTDIQGSTHLWESAPDAMRPALARHDHLLRQAIAQHGGYVFKTIGDAFCAAFPTAPDALAAALAAQVTLAAEPWGLPTPLRVRMGLHTGSAEERDGDYFGPPLNRVARLMAAGHGGQTLLSLAAQELTRDALPAGMSLLDLGQHRLKDLRRPETVFQLLHPSLPAEFPPLSSLDNPALPNNLPQQVTSFIGREAQVAEVKALLTKTRLLTLTGAGGSGKSRLSLQVAADLLDGEGDGVWLVELASLSDPTLVPQAVATVLGVKEAAGKSIQQSLVEWLRPKRLLLIFDNCEHLVAACASLAADILRHCPDVRIMASSREPLSVTGEQTYRVPSLSLPDPKKAQTAESLSQYEAVRLFIERAQAVQPTFSVTDANAPAVAQVCFHLDGIPLAIELAAARIRSLSAEEINRRLDQRFRLLTGGSRDTLPRQQTLRALIDWSYDLLTEPEKALLRRLSVFAGGWTLSAAEVVCAGEPVEDFDVLDLLTALVDKSLVIYEGDAAGGGRSRLLETVRQYAGDRLQEGGDVEARQERAAAWFLALAEEAEPQLTGPEQGVWLLRLDTEHDNLRASLSWYEKSAAGGEAGIRLAGALWRLWWTYGHFSEGRQWLGKALGKTSGQEEAAGFGALTARSKALNGAGNLAEFQGDYVEARALHEESLAIKRQLGDQQGHRSLAQQPGECGPETERLHGGTGLVPGEPGNQAAVGGPTGHRRKFGRHVRSSLWAEPNGTGNPVMGGCLLLARYDWKPSTPCGARGNGRTGFLWAHGIRRGSLRLCLGCGAGDDAR
jgi:predicted ATPase/class 3 adenylate cyclase